MQLAAELLRYLLILLQIALLFWLLAADLWRQLPMFALWLCAEMAARIPFSPAGNYWHAVWIPLQPTLLFLLAAAAVEARFHAGERADTVALAALIVAPVGIGLRLNELATMRLCLNAGLVVILAPCCGTFTATMHARLLAALCCVTAALGWMPATGEAWWAMRCGYLATYCALCGGWLWILTREER